MTHHIGWGTPPLPLLPTPLARVLAGVPVPAWLADILGDNSAGIEALAGDVWRLIPRDEETRERIADYVLSVVKEKAGDLAHVVIGHRGLDSIESLLLRASGRARTAILRASRNRDPLRLETLRFGDLLDQRSVGPRTALEVAAILDAAGSTPIDRVPAETQLAAPPPSWGEAGSPLLPVCLRRALADERLPEWVRADLRLSPDATPASLDASVWQGIEALPARVRRFLVNLVTYRIDVVRDVRVVEDGWPDSVEPETISWPTRVANALSGQGLLRRERLETVTYGELLELPALGIKSVLDFASIVESITNREAADVVGPVLVNDLATAADEDWSDRLRADDPRFRDVAPLFLGSFAALFEDALSSPNSPRAHALARSLPQIRARAAEIAAEPLDRAFEYLLTSLGCTRRHVKIVKARIGWNEDGPQTLEKVGEAFGLTRERVRQITAKVLNRLMPTYLPQLERAIQELETAAPVPVADARDLLVDAGISSTPLDPRGVATVAGLLGYEATFQVDAADGSPWILPAGQAGTAAIFAAARRLAGKVGVSNVDEVQASLSAAGREIGCDEVGRILRGSTKVAFLEGDWFWVPDVPADRNRLRNVSQRMLSVAPRLDVPTLRQGIRRRYRFMRIETVPPVGVLEAFYAAHPEFALHDDGTVESTVPLDYRLVLGEVERAFVEAFRSIPTGLMDRVELEDALTKRGINPNTLAVFTTYSPVLDHPATNVWCLRGADVDPAALEAHRVAAATRTRRRRTLAYGWDDDGRLRLSVTVANVSSPVVGIPAAISRYVAGRRFAAVTKEGTDAGTVVVDEGGASWGYGPFLWRRGAEPGDPLTMRFDLTSDQVLLTLGDEADLDENGENA